MQGNTGIPVQDFILVIFQISLLFPYLTFLLYIFTVLLQFIH